MQGVHLVEVQQQLSHQPLGAKTGSVATPTSANVDHRSKLQSQDAIGGEKEQRDAEQERRHDLKSMIRLLQSKLHPSGEQVMQASCREDRMSHDTSLRSGNGCSSSSDCSPGSSPQDFGDANETSLGQLEDEGDSLSLNSSSSASNCSSSLSCSSSPAPTPPPRLSSLQRRALGPAEVAPAPRPAAGGGAALPPSGVQEVAGGSGCSQQMNGQQQGAPDFPAKTWRHSGDNKSVPLVTHATASSLLQLQLQQQQLQLQQIQQQQQQQLRCSLIAASQQQQMLNAPQLGNNPIAMFHPQASPRDRLAAPAISQAALASSRGAQLQQAHYNHNHHHANQLNNLPTATTATSTQTNLLSSQEPQQQRQRLTLAAPISQQHGSQRPASGNYSPPSSSSSSPPQSSCGNQSRDDYPRQQQQQVFMGNQPKGLSLIRLPEFAFGDSRRAPITKAVQEMVNQKQQLKQQQATFVINTPSSRHPIRGCALPPLPAPVSGPKSKPPVQPKPRLPARPHKQLGSISSASMSSISSVASSTATIESVAALQQQHHHNQVAQRHQQQQQKVIELSSCQHEAKISPDSVQLLVQSGSQLDQRQPQQQQAIQNEGPAQANDLLMMQTPPAGGEEEVEEASNDSKPKAGGSNEATAALGAKSEWHQLAGISIDRMRQQAADNCATTGLQQHIIAARLAAGAAGSMGKQELPTLQQVQQQQQRLKMIQRRQKMELEQVEQSKRVAGSSEPPAAGRGASKEAASGIGEASDSIAMAMRPQQNGRQQPTQCQLNATALRRPDNEAPEQQQQLHSNATAPMLEMERQQQQRQRQVAATTNTCNNISNNNNYHSTSAGRQHQPTTQTFNYSEAKSSHAIGRHQPPGHSDNTNHNNLLTTADGNSLRRLIVGQQEEATSKVSSAAREPQPAPRTSSASSSPPLLSATRDPKHLDELSILTSSSALPNPRLKDTALDGIASLASQSSTPSNSILSDSTTLITEAAMNSSELIPKLIERLDRKLIVMKEEQLTLMREIELNETTGQRLFESMKQHLTVNEYEKISLHANEIEKVTKLILSLRLRLKRVETELKERQMQQKRSDHQHRQQQLLEQSCHSASEDGGLDRVVVGSESESSISFSSKLNQSTSQQQHQLQQQTVLGNSASSKQLANCYNVRGVSDPTSTIGLPKRNHQHHASLQPQSQGQQQKQRQQPFPDDGSALAASSSSNEPYNDGQSEAASGGGGGSCRSTGHQLCSSANGRKALCSVGQQVGAAGRRALAAPATAQSQQSADHGQLTEADEEAKGGANSTSSDSIFNCSDSAIGGSTITSGHGGSATNIADQHQQAPTISQSSLSSAASTHSSLASSASHQHRRRHHHHHQSESPSQSHLSSNISVSSSISSSSVPSSPPLVSPASTTCLGASSPLSSNANSETTGATAAQKSQSGNCNTSTDLMASEQLNLSAQNLSALFSGPNMLANLANKSIQQQDGNNNNSATNSSDLNDSMMHLLTDTDILIAKRNKLVSQLEEAHQLEECIIKRNNIIIQRILKKYYDETGQEGEIAGFKQFTKLKSLLLKDTHDVADRIDNAELHLTELRQSSNQCNA